MVLQQGDSLFQDIRVASFASDELQLASNLEVGRCLPNEAL